VHGERTRRVKTRAAEVGAAGARAGLSERIEGKTAVVCRRKATAGAKLVEVATELGMKFHTLSRWMGERRPTAGFERVEVIAPVAPRALIVHSPRGLPIEGLDVAGVAEFVRRVGE
jgi:hypothetical protein